LLSYTALMILMYFMQERMVYFPDKEIRETPANIGLQYEEILFQAQDGVSISGWYVPAEKERGAILFCHGNAGNISHRLESIKIFHDLGMSVFIFDYRGYGKSEGRPSETGTYLDAAAAWEYLSDVKKKSSRSIIIFGRSLGGAVAAELALRKNPGGLIIESSFRSLPDLGKKFYPWLPVRLLTRFKYATIDKVASIGCPKLIVHSPEDEIVPFAHGRAIYEKAAPPKEFLKIRGGHNEGFLVSGDMYTEGLRRFLKKALLERQTSGTNEGFIRPSDSY
jgi:fermentation-respiration switch protein FrsA (DUF1100 family)